jgi:hypothetical protein
MPAPKSNNSNLSPDVKASVTVSTALPLKVHGGGQEDRGVPLATQTGR